MNLIGRLRKASFRGFEFAIASGERDFGRDVQRQKIINGDDVYYEDVGIKESVFSVEAVIGGRESFIEEADQFEAILSQKGPGRLVLPDSKELNVVVMSARRRTSSDEVGIVYFSITFEKVAPESARTGAFVSKIPAAASGLSSIFATDFVEKFRANVPDFVTASVMENIAAVEEFLAPLLNKQGVPFSFPGLDFSDAAGFLNGIKSSFNGIVSLFSPKVNYTVALNNAPVAHPATAPSIVNALTAASRINVNDTVASPAVSQSIRARNVSATALAVKVMLAHTAASILPFMEFESKNQALSLRRDMLGTMTATRSMAGEARWYKTYGAMGSLMAAVNTEIDEVLGALPRTIQIRPQITRSATLTAYRLYGDEAGRVIAMSRDIVSRNRIIHPSFIAPENMEVLADV